VGPIFPAGRLFNPPLHTFYSQSAIAIANIDAFILEGLLSPDLRKSELGLPIQVLCKPLSLATVTFEVAHLLLHSDSSRDSDLSQRPQKVEYRIRTSLAYYEDMNTSSVVFPDQGTLR
jgi:hypothetical protein